MILLLMAKIHNQSASDNLFSLQLEMGKLKPAECRGMVGYAVLWNGLDNLMCTEFTQCLGLKKEVCFCKNKPGFKKVLFKSRENKNKGKNLINVSELCHLVFS